MGKSIKIRLLKLDKKQTDLVAELRKMGYKISPCELSNYINGNVQTPKANKVLESSNKILKEWENNLFR